MIEDELDNLLVRQLSFEWSIVNRDHLGEALDMPAIELFDADRRLGRWQPASRVLALSRTFVKEARWGQVIEVLKHEMAHQYVSEVLEAEDTPHGDAFVHACRRLGIDPAASGAVPGKGERHPVVRRIEKLLALARSDNPHEAEAALKRARRLMLEHNVAVGSDPVAHYVFQQVGPIKKRFMAWEKVLSGAIARHFFVRVIWARAFDVERGSTGRVLELMGAPENVEFAAWAHDYLRYTAGKTWREHKRQRGLRGNKHRQRFLAGFMFGVDDQLQKQTAAVAETGLVWVGDAALDAHVEARHPRLVRGRGVSVTTNNHFDSGASEGRKVDLRRPIEHDRRRDRGALPGPGGQR